MSQQNAVHIILMLWYYRMYLDNQDFFFFFLNCVTNNFFNSLSGHAPDGWPKASILVIFKQYKQTIKTDRNGVHEWSMKVKSDN